MVLVAFRASFSNGFDGFKKNCKPKYSYNKLQNLMICVLPSLCIKTLFPQSTNIQTKHNTYKIMIKTQAHNLSSTI
ncbi:hypothetical protein Hanom_Chr09g00836641 [Helianthus anomalus]